MPRLALVLTALVVIRAGDPYYGMFCLAGIALTLAPVRVPLGLELAVLGLMIVDMTLGNAAGLYRALPWLDKALHVVGAALLALLVLQRVPRPRWLDAGAVALLVLGVGAVWELAEFGVDSVLARRTQSAPGLAPHDDTMLDLALDALGAAAGALLGVRVRRTMAA